MGCLLFDTPQYIHNTLHPDSIGKPYLVERSEFEWDGEIRDEIELGILEEAHL